MAAGDVFRIAVTGGLNAQSIVNVFHYKQTTPNTSGLSNVESLARAFATNFQDPYINAASLDASWGVIESRTFNPPAVPLEGFDLGVTWVGGGEDPACPPTVAVVIRKKTSFLGRKYRGRNYFAGIQTTNVFEGRVTVAGIAPWEALRDAMAATIVHTVAGSPSFAPCIAALDASVVVAPVGVRNTVITSCFLDTVLRSQRRREIGVGA